MNLMTYRQSERVCYPKARGVLGPKRLKMDGLTNLSAAIHLGGKPFQLRKLELRRCCWVRYRNFKLKVELIAHLLVVVPALASPSRPGLVAFDMEPVLILLFIQFDILHTPHFRN